MNTIYTLFSGSLIGDPSWESLEKNLKYLAKKINKKNIPFTCAVGIASGGAFYYKISSRPTDD